MLGSNAVIYVGLLGGAAFTFFSLYKIKTLPPLADIFSLMLSATAAYSGVELCVSVLEGAKKLGDFQDQKLTIVLGAVAVCWVALLTSISLVKGIMARAVAATAPEPSPAPAADPAPIQKSA